MPNVDMSITIASVLAICAIISPIITTLINNHHNWRIHKAEMKREDYKNTILYKRSIYENYLRTAGRCIYYADDVALKDYGEHYMAALMCSEGELHAQMIEVNKHMQAYDWEKAMAGLELITPKIHALVEKA